MIYRYSNMASIIMIGLLKGKILRKAFLLVFLTTAMLTVSAQNQENNGAVGNKTKYSIKPNSRDVNVVLRDNSFQRMDKQRKQIMVRKMHPSSQQKLIKKNVDQSRRQEMMQRRRQLIEQRRTLRR